MDKIEIQIKQDEKFVNDIAEKLEIVTNTKFVAKEKRNNTDANWKRCSKNQMTITAGQKIIKYEKELDVSNQINKKNENNIGDDKVLKVFLNKVFE